MIGKPQWFKTRKYGGWGLSPATKEGWLYVAGFIAIVAAIQALPLIETVKTAIVSVLVVIVLLDVLDIMFHIKKDEREVLHEALSERNASWAMISTMVILFGYQAITAAFRGSEEIDPTILIPMFTGVAAKALTNLYLRNK